MTDFEDEVDEIFRVVTSNGQKRILLGSGLSFDMRSAYRRYLPVNLPNEEIAAIQVMSVQLWARLKGRYEDVFGQIYSSFYRYGAVHGAAGYGPKIECMIAKMTEMSADPEADVDSFLHAWYIPVKKKRRAVKFYADVIAKEQEKELKKKRNRYQIY